MWFELGHHIAWYIHDYECFGGAFLVCLHRPSDDGSSWSRPNRLFWPIRLHDPIIENNTISNHNVIHFSCIVSLCYKKLMYTFQAIHSPAILHFTWSQQKCIAGNIMKNSKVCCLMSVCSCFVIILKVYIF
jgi:hypothetical protein